MNNFTSPTSVHCVLNSTVLLLSGRNHFFKYINCLHLHAINKHMRLSYIQLRDMVCVFKFATYIILFDVLSEITSYENSNVVISLNILFAKHFISATVRKLMLIDFYIFGVKLKHPYDG